MNTEILGVILQWVALVVLCYPLGRYIAKVYRGERTWLDFMAPVERFVYRVCGIDPAQEMDWKQFLKALLMVNLFWFFWGMLLLVFQGWLPLNPDGNPGQSPDLAFNTCISFMVNCNLQHYSGETGLSYFTQLFVIMLFQFVTAACGMAAMAGVMKALAAKTTKTIGNFWVFLTKSVTRILMPLSLVVGILLVINGTPMSFDGKQTITTLEGQEQVISQGPTAAIVPIKQLGTNGGGYFGTNSAHPLENPNAFTNILECWSILILPMAMAFAFGFYTRRRRLAAWIFAVMLFAYIAGVVFSVWQETGGSRQIDRMGIAQELGSMEGKEIRIGSAASAMWGMTTTVTSNGSVDSMHDSQTPLSGMLLNNPSFHGLSEMLYEYTSSAANNGSGFEGLADNTPFWNISTGIALIMGRYFPIVGQVAIAGLLASKKYIPESAGTLKTDTGTFSLMTFAVIIIVAALSFFPALALGPIADYLTF